jgi:dTDP-4-dehydrorhamnose reductase
MRVLILGMTGMLGHKLCQVLSTDFDVIGTMRDDYAVVDKLKMYKVYDEIDIRAGVDARNIVVVEDVIEQAKPDVVINCIAILKNVPEEKDVFLNILINALFPHQLHDICRKRNTKLIHISTDGVFSGNKGNYSEKDPADAIDVYGKAKYLGELSDINALTIRTSLIGRELYRKAGLVEWFMAQNNSKIRGYLNAIFSGFTTLEFAAIVADIIARKPELKGIYHISSDPISKYDLLLRLREKMKLNIDIEKSAEPYCDRSLDSTAFRNLTGFTPLPWDMMIDRFVDDSRKNYNLYKKKV